MRKISHLTLRKIVLLLHNCDLKKSRNLSLYLFDKYEKTTSQNYNTN